MRTAQADTAEEALTSWLMMPGLPDVDDAFSRRETLELVRAYYRITDPAIRKRVFDLIKSMGPPEA